MENWEKIDLISMVLGYAIATIIAKKVYDAFVRNSVRGALEGAGCLWFFLGALLYALLTEILGNIF